MLNAKPNNTNNTEITVYGNKSVRAIVLTFRRCRTIPIKHQRRTHKKGKENKWKCPNIWIRNESCTGKKRLKFFLHICCHLSFHSISYSIYYSSNHLYFTYHHHCFDKFGYLFYERTETQKNCLVCFRQWFIYCKWVYDVCTDRWYRHVWIIGQVFTLLRSTEIRARFYHVCTCVCQIDR